MPPMARSLLSFLLDHAMNIPVYHDIGWVLTKINPYSKMNAVYGIQNWKIKNWGNQLGRLQHRAAGRGYCCTQEQIEEKERIEETFPVLSFYNHNEENE